MLNVTRAPLTGGGREFYTVRRADEQFTYGGVKMNAIGKGISFVIRLSRVVAMEEAVLFDAEFSRRLPRSDLGL